MQTYAEFEAADMFLAGMARTDKVETNDQHLIVHAEHFEEALEILGGQPGLSTLMINSPAWDQMEAYLGNVSSFTTIKKFRDHDLRLTQRVEEAVENLATVCQIPQAGYVKRFLFRNADLCELAWDAAYYASTLDEVKKLRLEVSKDADSEVERLCLNCFLDSDDMDLWDQVEDQILQSAFAKWAIKNRTRMFVSLSHVDEL